jgi:hypothetical protein
MPRISGAEPRSMNRELQASLKVIATEGKPRATVFQFIGHAEGNFRKRLKA